MAGVSGTLIAEWQKELDKDTTFKLAQNVSTKNNILDVLRGRSVDETPIHYFNHKLETEGKPVTNQKSSGRCWIFACLNCMRLPLMKTFNLDELELSQNYVFFWDKIERMHYQLTTFVDSAKKGEEADGRLVHHLLNNPSEDGGQWDMLVNIIEKHGVMPKKCFPDTWSAENSRQMDLVLNNKMREFCMTLRAMVKDGKTEEAIKTEIANMVKQIHRIVSICVGTPPSTFKWEYYDKSKVYKSEGPISPLDFYKTHVKPVFDMESKVCLVHDPRTENPSNKSYTVEYLNNMTDSRPILYVNVEMDVIKDLAVKSIKANEAVWFCSDVGKHCSWKKIGIEDLKLYDHELVFGTSVQNMSKKERLLYRDSLMTHAMTLTGVLEEDGKCKRWRIENSWGDDGGEKGYLMMTDDWFAEYLFEIVVDKKHVPQEILDILTTEPKVLPAWDPMGAVAKQH